MLSLPLSFDLAFDYILNIFLLKIEAIHICFPILFYLVLFKNRNNSLYNYQSSLRFSLGKNK